MLQIVITLEIYGVKKIVGIPYGYRGFSDKELAEMPVSSCLSFRCTFNFNQVLPPKRKSVN